MTTSTTSEISDYILSRYPGPLHVLEAGGGSARFFSYPPGSRFTVVDISPEQQASNDYAEEFVLQDLHEYPFGSGRFDIVVFHNVLEHLTDPASVVTKALESLKPGGAMIVGGPIVSSIQGLLTKFSPHWFHVLIYRHVFRHPTAGQPGSPPFPTYLRWAADSRNLRDRLATAGAHIAVYREFESGQVERVRQRSSALFFLYRGVSNVVWALSLGRVRRRSTDFQILAVKPG